MKRILHLEQLIDFVRERGNNEQHFEHLYQKLEEEYVLVAQDENSKDYADDLYLTLKSSAKKYLFLRTPVAYKQFAQHFLTDIEAELFRIKKTSNPSTIN